MPCAAGGSLPFLFVRSRAGTILMMLGIDFGITLVMAKNHRTGLVWNTFMKNSEAQAAMGKVGFRQE